MAKVDIKFSDDLQLSDFEFEIEEKLKDFLKKHSTDLGDELVNSFYSKTDTGIDVLMWLEDSSINTHDDDPKIKSVLNLISKTVGENDPGFGLGYEGFNDKLYEDLLEALGYPVEIWFDATVVGYGDEYTSCVYELTNKGWKVNSADLYVWNEDEGEYQIP